MNKNTHISKALLHILNENLNDNLSQYLRLDASFILSSTNFLNTYSFPSNKFKITGKISIKQQKTAKTHSNRTISLATTNKKSELQPNLSAIARLIQDNTLKI